MSSKSLVLSSIKFSWEHVHLNYPLIPPSLMSLLLYPEILRNGCFQLKSLLLLSHLAPIYHKGSTTRITLVCLRLLHVILFSQQFTLMVEAWGV